MTSIGSRKGTAQLFSRDDALCYSVISSFFGKGLFAGPYLLIFLWLTKHGLAMRKLGTIRKGCIVVDGDKAAIIKSLRQLVVVEANAAAWQRREFKAFFPQRLVSTNRWPKALIDDLS
jgi:hypothetical protein